MICVVYEGYGSSIPTLIFITCIWFPFLQIKHAILNFLSTFSRYCYCTQNQDLNDQVFPNIYHHSDVQFSDLLSGDEEVIRPVDESCSICLAEFRDHDSVSQLSRCRHVFHSGCIEGWLDRGQFTCPLCRSNLLAKRVRN
ncbi:hypothetical protein OSB04_026758 [Centaurea solstitialis]|uniref:RING-type domain-containing protein n=1 Tax=Centaurea solstitialis TaxID=347529 RepID=A0AA38SW07_9ASTR|nr:hypothetical protein OSB04_026758 [Centaurea solstitialis]